jgi:hypothetical protein
MNVYNKNCTIIRGAQSTRPCGAKRPRTYRGYESENVNGHATFTAKRDLPEICFGCGKDIEANHQYTNFNKDLWHLSCVLKYERDGVKNPFGGLRI